ncbi:MAG: hypothetical protein JRJ21_05345 [Deltaproteobacteria bacterium]|nr:hypothetical protein [Deltaproteobacteria bacterium]
MLKRKNGKEEAEAQPSSFPSSDSGSASDEIKMSKVILDLVGPLIQEAGDDDNRI